MKTDLGLILELRVLCLDRLKLDSNLFSRDDVDTEIDVTWTTGEAEWSVASYRNRDRDRIGVSSSGSATPAELVTRPACSQRAKTRDRGLEGARRLTKATAADLFADAVLSADAQIHDGRRQDQTGDESKTKQISNAPPQRQKKEGLCFVEKVRGGQSGATLRRRTWVRPNKTESREQMET
jgi:hypothetical protein